MDMNSRMDNIEFRMDLLREGTEFTRYVYDCKITEEQMRQLYNIMDKYRSAIDKNEKVSSAVYETEILNVVGRENLDYHFCEDFAQLLWQENRYKEVFENLYGDSNKFKHLFVK